MSKKDLHQKLYQMGQELIKIALELDQNLVAPAKTNKVTAATPEISTYPAPKPLAKTYVRLHRGRYEARYKLPGSKKIEYLGSYKTEKDAIANLTKHINGILKTKVAKA